MQDEVLVRNYQLSIFVAALLLYGLINATFYFVDSRNVLSAKTRNERYFDFPGLNKICLKAANDDNKVLLLGSSLFVHPLRVLDKKLGEKIGLHCPDFNQYHAAAHLDNKLKAEKIQCNGVITLSVGGSMVSDYFLLLNKYVNGKKHFPHWVFVDCDPRAFFDSGVTEARITPLFNCLFNLKDMVFLGQYYLPTLLTKVEFLAKYFCPLYAHGKWLSASLNEFLNTEIDSLSLYLFKGSTVKTTNSLDFKEAKQITKNNIDIEVVEKMKGSLQEYRHRYAGLLIERINSQLYFLQLLAQMCKLHNSRVVLVNMPLTMQNKGLLGEVFYSAFKNSIERVAQEEAALYADLDGGGKFLPADFDDSVHLGYSGGEKLENEIVKLIRTNPLNSQFSEQP